MVHELAEFVIDPSEHVDFDADMQVELQQRGFVGVVYDSDDSHAAGNGNDFLSVADICAAVRANVPGGAFGNGAADAAKRRYLAALHQQLVADRRAEYDNMMEEIAQQHPGATPEAIAARANARNVRWGAHLPHPPQMKPPLPHSKMQAAFVRYDES
jgi:hypothetical protein